MNQNVRLSIAENCRILSVQSHVVSGHVGNRAAIFPLQTLGFDVDFINTVQFSNHTGYPMVKGSILDGQQLDQLSEALEHNELLDYDYLITGYIGSDTFLLSVIRLLENIRKLNPHVRYICDPVLGDDGKYYVPPQLVSIFRRELIPRSYMITPNQFEAELLMRDLLLVETGKEDRKQEDQWETGSEQTLLSSSPPSSSPPLSPSLWCITNEYEALSSILALHSLGPQIVCLTSTEYSSPPHTPPTPTPPTPNTPPSSSPDSSSSSSSSSSSENKLYCYILHPLSLHPLSHSLPPSSSHSISPGEEGEEGERREGGGEGEGESVVLISRIEIDKISGHFTGTGDATSSLMTGWTHLLENDLHPSASPISSPSSIPSFSSSTPTTTTTSSSESVRIHHLSQLQPYVTPSSPTSSSSVPSSPSSPLLPSSFWSEESTLLSSFPSLFPIFSPPSSPSSPSSPSPLSPSPFSSSHALRHTLSTLQCMIQKTISRKQQQQVPSSLSTSLPSSPSSPHLEKARSSRLNELQVISSKSAIESPPLSSFPEAKHILLYRK